MDHNIQEYLSKIAAKDTRDDILDELEDDDLDSNKYLEKIAETTS